MHAALYAPVGRDASVLATVLAAAQLESLVCTGPDPFIAALDETALLAIVTEEGLMRCPADRLAERLREQPLWSNIPIIVLADANALLPGGATRALEKLGNVTLITRPLRREELLLAILSAQRTRLLQFQVRDQLAQLGEHAAELERRVDQRTAALAHEVRERRQMEASLAESRRLESLGRLTGGVAHDFNNLLQVISGATQVMRLMGRDLPQLQRPLDSIARATEQGARLTQQLLAFARRQPMQNAMVRLEEQLPTAAQLLRHSLGKQIKLHVDIATPPWPVKTDLAQLEIALLNLAINARDAMPRGGTVTLSARNLELPAFDLPELAELRGQYVEVALRDDGEGMTEAVARQAFEPFFTTKPLGKGTGLGLSQVYGYAQQSGGTAYLRSSPAGTLVAIVLPRGDEGQPAKPAAAPSADPAQIFAGLRVLCVEDDALVAEVAVALFAALGCMVCCAENAEAALLSDLGKIDLVFSDVRMPGKLDGVEMARRLARTHPRLPVVLASGFIGEPDRLKGLAVEFVRKPYTTEMVVKAASAALAKVRPVAGARGDSRPDEKRA
jgi:signal transduction histidine kinase